MDTAHFDQMKAERDEARRVALAIRAEAGWKETWPFPWEQSVSKNIIVNGKTITMNKDVLSYGEVLELAYPGIDPTRIFWVRVEHRSSQIPAYLRLAYLASLVPGQNTRIADGSIFRAYDTSNA